MGARLSRPASCPPSPRARGAPTPAAKMAGLTPRITQLNINYRWQTAIPVGLGFGWGKSRVARDFTGGNARAPGPKTAQGPGLNPHTLFRLARRLFVQRAARGASRAKYRKPCNSEVSHHGTARAAT